jgi:ParB family chromosome partitioning protein
MWDLHDRLSSHITEESCRAEIESVERHGQLVPALGRPLIEDPTHDFELIYGARRLFVARHLKKHLLLEVRTITDRDAIIAMDIENRHRLDISPYERGLSYASWLRSGHFSSQDDIAKSLRISASQVSRLIKLTRLPSVIVDAFRSATEICEIWGLEITEALEDPKRRIEIISAARTLARLVPRETGEVVYRELLQSGHRGRKVKKPAHDEVVHDSGGSPLFRVRHHRNAVALVFPLEKLSRTFLEQIRDAACLIMRGGEDVGKSDTYKVQEAREQGRMSRE